MANKAAGKGYENENFYSDIKFQFLGIENIHVMRNSLQKLIDGRSQAFCFAISVCYVVILRLIGTLSEANYVILNEVNS